MGNNNVKQAKSSLFSGDELVMLKNSYKSINGNLEALTQDKLNAQWCSLLDHQLLDFTFNHLFGIGKNRTPTTTFNLFSEFFFILNHGTIDEKVKLIQRSIGQEKLDDKVFKNYVNAVVKSYLICVSKQPEYSSWEKNGYKAEENTIEVWTKSFTKSLDEKLMPENLEKWLQENPTFLIIWLKTYASLYKKESDLSNFGFDGFLPLCDGIPLNQNYSPLIELPEVMFLNSLLPTEFRHKWRFLFSSKIHGQSFSTMLGKILGKYPTLFIVEDEDDFIFGGYATAEWALSPKFAGDNTSMLFTLSPNMRYCPATTYNNHFQYLNLNQQTMPNGLGMGGQFDFWGLWIDVEYGIGHSSESCTTYRDYCQLSGKKNFNIKNLEVWAVGDEPRKDDDDDEEPSKLDGKRSVLDKHLEDKVMLELAGQTLHSEGLREPNMDA